MAAAVPWLCLDCSLGDGLRLPFPPPAEQTQCAKAGAEEWQCGWQWGSRDGNEVESADALKKTVLVSRAAQKDIVLAWGNSEVKVDPGGEIRIRNRETEACRIEVSPGPRSYASPV